MPNEPANSQSLGFKQEESKPVLHMVILGTGNIGKQFLQIVAQSGQALCPEKINLVAVANSRYFQFGLEGIDLDEIQQAVHLHHDNSRGQVYTKLEQLIGLDVVVVDLTASESVADQYLCFAQNGWHIISANKTAAANHDYAAVIEAALNKKHLKWLKNTTVGAALPIQNALQKITESGDQICQVSGVFSGSISWLLAQYDGDKGFLDWVRQAQVKALTEPDPRADLSGLDVHRKALILARECGFDPQEVNFKPVLPAHWLKGTLSDFWQQQTAIDQYMHKQLLQAQQSQQKLQYLATVNDKQINIELKAIAQHHAAAQLQAGDNIFIVESDHYSTNPLVIKGPGAGKEVTAAGVMSDLAELLQHQGIL